MVRKVVDSMNEVDPSTAVLSSFLDDFIKHYAQDIDSVNKLKKTGEDYFQDINEAKMLEEEELDMMNDITLIATANYRLQH